jgi:hypothetical protein
MDKNRLLKIKFFLKIKIILLALLTPIIVYLFNSDLESLSACWRDDFKYLFIISNLLTSLLFLITPKWRISAIFLILLTLTPVTKYQITHNIIAITFFLYNVYPMISFKRYNFFLLFYVFSLMWLPNLFLTEIHAISVLCLYHTIIISKIYFLKR